LKKKKIGFWAGRRCPITTIGGREEMDLIDIPRRKRELQGVLSGTE